MSFVNHSISLLEEMDQLSQGAFCMNRPGYLFVTKKPTNTYIEQGKYAESIGIGPYKYHSNDISSYRVAEATKFMFDDPTLRELHGVEVIHGSDAIHKLFPFLDPAINASRHVRKCGWIQVPKLIAWMLAQSGATVKQAKVEKVEQGAKLRVHLNPNEELVADKVVIAVGPALANLDKLVGAQPVTIPLMNEIHAKVVIDDTDGLIPESSPLIHLDDDVELEWTDEQRQFLQSQPHLHYMLKPIRFGAHFRPGPPGSGEHWGIWTFPEASMKEPAGASPPRYPVVDEYYGEIVLRGMAAIVPALRKYFNPAANPLSSSNKHIKAVVSGHYCKTPENRPVIGPLPSSSDANIVICGALSGFGIMSSVAAGELAAHYVAGTDKDKLPGYSTAFLASRFGDPEYIAAIDQLAKSSGQL